MPMAGMYSPDGTYWTPISDHRSRYVDELADPWDEFTLGLRVHDEFIACWYGEDAFTGFLLAHDPATAPRR
jgi:hypothetical protein